MPNTLAHVGVQGLLSRVVSPIDLARWVFLGCVAPDVPWILLRIVHTVAPPSMAYDNFLYAAGLSSLAVTLLLCAALVQFSVRPMLAFALVSSNVLLHLLFDGLQSKWANGPILLAPFSWRSMRFDFFWPESPLDYALTASGLVYFVLVWRSAPPSDPWLTFRPAARRVAASVFLLALYFLAPLPFLGAIESADVHSIGTLRDREHRAGKPVEFDRVFLRQENGRSSITALGREELTVLGLDPVTATVVSLGGVFVDSGTVRAAAVHLHRGGFRNLASYVGLALIAASWLAASFRAWQRPRTPCPDPAGKRPPRS